jgi:hypothetical protein
MQKKSPILLNHAVQHVRHVINGIVKECINIGCGSEIRPFWINCDVRPECDSVLEFDITKFDDLQWLRNKRADIITCDHVIGYITVAQADNFFIACRESLGRGGELIIEFPDLKKIATRIFELDYSKDSIDYDYIEVIRAIYAYDQNDALSTEFNLKTYITGWTSEFLVRRLKMAGFEKIVVEAPRTHGRRSCRDSRVVATG